MRLVYRVLALLIALGVAVQAAAVAFGDSGLFVWVANGGVLDAAAMEGAAPPFPEVTGFMVHGMNGMMVIPAITLILLVVSFFARVPRGILLAGGLVVAVALQITLGLLGHALPLAGLLHGGNAMVVFTLALAAARAASTARAAGVAAGVPAQRTTRGRGTAVPEQPPHAGVG